MISASGSRRENNDIRLCHRGTETLRSAKRNSSDEEEGIIFFWISEGGLMSDLLM
jgi:hypothetical protein